MTKKKGDDEAVSSQCHPPSSARTIKISKPTSISSNGCRPAAAWTMASLMEALARSPTFSTACSPKSDPLVLLPTSDHTSSSRNQNSVADGKEVSTSTFSEIDEWIGHGKSFSPFLLSSQKKKNNNPKGKGMNQSDGSLKGSKEKEFVQTRASIREEGCSAIEVGTHLACTQSMRRDLDAESPDDGRRRLMVRPKPYHTFLDEVKQQEFEAEIEAWKKAKQMKIVDNLERREAAISDWENEETIKAIEEMKKLEGKLEKKRGKLVERAQKRICKAKVEANKKKTKVRRSSVEKISTVSRVSGGIQRTKSLLWLKLMKFC